MKDAIKVSIIDRVTGICPPCKHAKITVVPDSYVHDGYGNLKSFTLKSYCEHEAVCSLRSSGDEPMPTEEEIVHCKDCKWLIEQDGLGETCTFFGAGICHDELNTGYCAWGE